MSESGKPRTSGRGAVTAAAQPTGEPMTEEDIIRMLGEQVKWHEEQGRPYSAGVDRDAIALIECLRSALPQQGAGEGGEVGVAPAVKSSHPYEPVKDGSVISADLLEHIRAFLVDHHDVVDGPAGYEHEQRPNRAMSLTNELDEEMGVRR